MMSLVSRKAGALAAMVVVTGAALTLAGCGAGASSDGAYISVTEGAMNLLVIDGSSLTIIDPVAGAETCDVIDQALDDIANGEISDSGDRYTIAQQGTLNESGTTAVWADEGSGAVTVESDTVTVTVENVFNASRTYDEIVFVPSGSDQADAYLADYCG